MVHNLTSLSEISTRPQCQHSKVFVVLMLRQVDLSDRKRWGW